MQIVADGLPYAIAEFGGDLVNVAEASGNASFNQIVGSFVPLMRVAVPQAWSTRRTAEEQADILDRHRKLAWAITNRDPEEAERRMAAHFDEAIGALLR